MIRDTTATFTTELKSDDALADLWERRTEAFLVAKAGTDVLGFITWGAFRAGPGYVQTAEHSIIAAQHRQGVGRALMNAAQLQAAGQGIHTFVAAISGDNIAAQIFHTRMGFVQTGRLPQVGRKQGRWLDLILMTKKLDLP